MHLSLIDEGQNVSYLACVDIFNVSTIFRGIFSLFVGKSYLLVPLFIPFFLDECIPLFFTLA